MNRRHFLQHTLLISGAVVSGALVPARALAAGENPVKIHFLRHATFLLEIDGLRLLVDPMLSKKDAWDPLGNAASKARIPMADLPLSGEELVALLAEVDGVIVTHTHFDHWDSAAQQLLGKQLPLIIQPSDEQGIRTQGFTHLLPVDKTLTFNGLKIHRTGGQHGTGDIGRSMGSVSGFIIQGRDHSIYIAGDTVWCADVERALINFKPDISVLNTGAARFLQGDPITMTADDVLMVAQVLPSTQIIAMHMDTINHCVLTRADLRKFAAQHKPLETILIPRDGDKLVL